nr:hypothetical protein [Nitrospira sp.]
RESGEWIVENIIHAHERAIYLAEKNVVGKHLLTLAASVPNADLWTVSKPAKRGVIMPGQVAFAVAYKGNVVASFNTKAEAESFVNQSVMSNTARAKSNYTVNRTVGDPQVVYMASGQLADNEVQVYVKGHAVRIQLIDPLLANAYKRLGQENLTGIMAMGRDINNFLSRAYTGLAPEFIVTNVQRDLLSGMVNILGEEGATVAARSLKNWPEAMYRMSRFSVTGNGDPWFNSYRESGGSTGGAYIGDLDRIGREVQATYDEAIGVFRMFRENRTGKASLLAAKKLLHIFTFWIEHMNAAAEGGMRLAAYRAKIETEAKRLGVTADVLRDEKSLRATVARNRAASLAKNSTVNFNRKGEKGAEINANFLFYNATVQGSAITAHALAKGKHKGQAWTAVVTLTGLAVLLASQFGDDEWEEIPQHEKDRNMLIKLGDTGYVAKYSVPYGHGLAFAMGNSLHDLSQGKAAGAVGYHMASAVFENLMPRNPLGEDAKSLEDYGWTNFVPEGAFLGVKWWSNIGINRDGFGRQIMPESKYDETQPDHLKMYSTLQGSIYDKITSSTNKATGGTDTQAGSVDVSPETLQFLFESITGGLGRFAVDEANVAKLAAQGSAPEVKEVPVVRKFARERNRASDARSEFWETLGKAEDYIANRTRAVKGNDSAALERMERGHAELSKWVNTYKDDATAIRDDINEKRNDDTLSAAKKREAIREIETSSVDTFRKMRHRLDDEMDLLKE